MQPHPQETVLRLGPALICWRPPPPQLWQAWLPLCPGPASLCLSLLPLARPRWQAVVHADGGPASPEAETFAALPLATLDPLLEGLCPPWLEEQEREAVGLQRHLAGRTDFPGLSCAHCREQEEQGEAQPDCAACPLPRPPASAGAALALAPFLDAPPWLLDEMLGGLWAGLPPSSARLLRMQLLLLSRWRRTLGGQGDCPLAGGRDTF
jgi:hypothetical protein